MTSRNTSTRTYLTLSSSHGSSLLTSPFTVHLQYMYTCIVGRESTLTASWVVVLETALRQYMRQRLLWDSRSRKQEQVIVAFTQGHDVFVALPTGFGNSLCCCCLPCVFDKLRGFTNASFAVVVSPGGEW